MRSSLFRILTQDLWTVQQVHALKENLELKKAIHHRIKKDFYLSSFKYSIKNLLFLYEDFVLPSLLFFFYQNEFNDILEYLNSPIFNSVEFSSLSNRIKNSLNDIENVQYPCKGKIKILGDLHPNGTTKILSSLGVLYRKFPDYYDLLSSLADEIFIDSDRFFPRIFKRGDVFVRDFVNIDINSSSENQIREFYYNLGRLIPFLLMLRTVDIHADNIIVSKNFPVFFDMETIFSGEFKVREKDQYNIKNTGIVKISNTRDVSLLTGGVDKRESLLKPLICGSKQRPEIKWRTFSKGRFYNIPEYKNIPVNPSDYIDDLENGYYKGSENIIIRKERILGIVCASNCFNRVVLRPTRLYRYYMLFSCYPQNYLQKDQGKFLREKLQKCSLLYDICFSDSFINYEINSLLKFEIPTFYFSINRKDIFSADGKVVASFNSPPKSYWKRYFIDRFNREFLEDQLSEIKDSL